MRRGNDSPVLAPEITRVGATFPFAVIANPVTALTPAFATKKSEYGMFVGVGVGVGGAEVAVAVAVGAAVAVGVAVGASVADGFAVGVAVGVGAVVPPPIGWVGAPLPPEQALTATQRTSQSRDSRRATTFNSNGKQKAGSKRAPAANIAWNLANG
jgi:hypothetical protein